jgi:hypothetical protein
MALGDTNCHLYFSTHLAYRIDDSDGDKMIARVPSKIYPGEYYEWDWDFMELVRYKSGPDGGIVCGICIGPIHRILAPVVGHGDEFSDYAILCATTVLEWVRLDEQYVLDEGNYT